MRIVFDTEALLAFYFKETGGELVKDFLVKVQKGEVEGYLNIVNLTEFYYILYRIKPQIAEEKERNLRAYGLKIVPVTDGSDSDKLWKEAGRIKGEHALSLADAFAAATARVKKASLLTGTDREFEGLGISLIRVKTQS